jgi:uncharacterized SAM-binding protein YcdF (DUF218 family)
VIETVSRRARNRFWRRLAVAILLAVLCWLAAWLGARGLIVSAPLEHADVIVVLSGSSTFVERTQLAAQLYAAGRAEKILLTNDNQQGGWSSAEQRNPFFYERALETLSNKGIPREKVEVLLQPVSSTRDEARLLRAYAEEYGLHSILFVTSAYHSRRALWTLRREFRNNKTEIGLVTVPPGNQTPSSATWWLHSRGWEMVPGEYLKIVYYWLRY